MCRSQIRDKKDGDSNGEKTMIIKTKRQGSIQTGNSRDSYGVGTVRGRGREPAKKRGEERRVWANSDDK
jgi:hypothetical protein